MLYMEISYFIALEIKLMQVNIFTKEFKDIKTLDNPIIFLSNDTLTTQGYTLNQYFAK
jgi:hypothetical protein